MNRDYEILQELNGDDILKNQINSEMGWTCMWGDVLKGQTTPCFNGNRIMGRGENKNRGMNGCET